MNETKKIKYTPNDAGCYFDGCAGDRTRDVICFAYDHGFTDKDYPTKDSLPENNTDNPELFDDLVIEAEDFMNDNFAVNTKNTENEEFSFYWGWNDGDFGLWVNEED